MARCETCGNDYDRAFEISAAAESHFFDSFECAIQAMAPECAHCGCKVIGHGVETNGIFFCCAHCVKQEGNSEVADRSEQGTTDVRLVR